MTIAMQDEGVVFTIEAYNASQAKNSKRGRMNKGRSITKETHRYGFPSGHYSRIYENALSDVYIPDGSF